MVHLVVGRRVAASALVLLLACWAGVTARQVQVWRTDRTLWAHAVRWAPEKPRPWINYGRELEIDHDYVGAAAAYRRALVASGDPRRGALERFEARTVAEVDLAHVLANTGHVDEALTLLEDVLAFNPDCALAWFVRGAIRAHRGACDGAGADFQEAHRLDASLGAMPCVSSWSPR